MFAPKPAEILDGGRPGRTCAEAAAARVSSPHQPSEAGASTPASWTKAVATEAKSSFIPRRWHDNSASGYKIRKHSAAKPRTSQSASIEKPKQTCKQDGPAPLLQKLNLQPTLRIVGLRLTRLLEDPPRTRGSFLPRYLAPDVFRMLRAHSARI
jgi:hypothetical protein